MLCGVRPGCVDIARQPSRTADVAQYEPALEAEHPGELVGQVGRKGDQREVPLDQLDPPPARFCDLLKVVLVVDKPARQRYPVCLCARSASSPTLTRTRQRAFVGPLVGPDAASST